MQTGEPGELAFQIGDVLVCPTCGLPIATLIVEKLYGEVLNSWDLAFAGKKFKQGEPPLCPDCGADWLHPMTVSRP